MLNPPSNKNIAFCGSLTFNRSGVPFSRNVSLGQTMPLVSVACSLPNHRDVLHFSAHTLRRIAPPQTYSIRGRAMQQGRNGQEG